MEDQSDQIINKLTGIERQLSSIRYTFGFGIIVVTIAITLAVPTVMRLITARLDTSQGAIPGMTYQNPNQVTHTPPATASSTAN